MNFAEKLFDLMKQGFDKVIDAFMILFSFLAKIFGYLIEFFKGIFYFIFKLFEVVVQIIQIFVAIFQFMFALAAGIFRTIKSWITVNPVADPSKFPLASDQGFAVIADLMSKVGLLTVVPGVLLALLWFYFILKMIGLFGGQKMGEG